MYGYLSLTDKKKTVQARGIGYFELQYPIKNIQKHTVLSTFQQTRPKNIFYYALNGTRINSRFFAN